MNAVTLQLSPIFRDFRSRMLNLRDAVTTDAAKIMRREEESSIRRLWYKTGATLSSLKEEFATENDRRIYRLFPTATSRRGAPYPLFGEYGTGIRGSLTGRPAPAEYKYGEKAGMAARRYSRTAVAAAKPKIDASAKERVRRFALNATVN